MALLLNIQELQNEFSGLKGYRDDDHDLLRTELTRFIKSYHAGYKFNVTEIERIKHLVKCCELFIVQSRLMFNEMYGKIYVNYLSINSHFPGIVESYMPQYVWLVPDTVECIFTEIRLAMKYINGLERQVSMNLTRDLTELNFAVKPNTDNVVNFTKR